MGRKKTKAGSSKASAAHRRELFKAAYIANGHNATQAAITAGYSAKTAGSQGQRLLKHVEVSGDLAATAEKTARIAGLSAERTLLEVARVAYADPRRMYREDGTMIPIRDLDDDLAAVVASVETDEIKIEGVPIGQATKVKLWDKNSALEKAMKHHGLYKEDNAQQQESLVLRIEAARPVKR